MRLWGRLLAWPLLSGQGHAVDLPLESVGKAMLPEKALEGAAQASIYARGQGHLPGARAASCSKML